MSSPSKSPSPSFDYCRICHDHGGDQDDALLTPCLCSGSVGRVHRRCLERWLSSSSSNNKGGGELKPKCELCGFQYQVTVADRAFTEWLCTRPLGEDQRNLASDMLCLLLLTPLAAGSAYLCMLGGRFFLRTGRSAGYGLIFLSSVLVLVYLVWFCLSLRFHFVAWRRWSAKNKRVKLATDEKKDEKEKGRSDSCVIKLEIRIKSKVTAS